MWRKIRKMLNSDLYFRAKLLLTFIINCLYAIFLFIIGQLYNSEWFYILSIYHALLFAVRTYIYSKLHMGISLRENIVIMRGCGYFLYLLNIVVSLMLAILMRTTLNAHYHEIIVITMATYTFTMLTLSIIDLVRFIKKGNRLYDCVAVIRLVSTCVSMVALANIMLTTFGENIEELRRIILPCLSGGVAFFIIACAIFIIRRANLDLKVLENEEK